MPKIYFEKWPDMGTHVQIYHNVIISVGIFISADSRELQSSPGYLILKMVVVPAFMPFQLFPNYATGEP